MASYVEKTDCQALRSRCAKNWRDRVTALIAVLAILATIYVGTRPNHGEQINQINRSVGKMEGQVDLILHHIRTYGPTLSVRG